MSVEVQEIFRPFEAPSERFSAQKFAERALNATARLWFVGSIAGQLLFAFTVAVFYSTAATAGNLSVWNRSMLRGHVPGDRMGNLTVAAHLISAVVIILAGALQFVPQIRNRYPRVHRWIGRMYILSAFTLTTAGLYMLWIRGSFGDVWLRLGTTLNVVLIWLCAAMAARYAIGRDFKTHRRWALRLYFSVSASFFFRAGFYLSLVVFRGPMGFDPKTFSGPFLTFMAFAQYLIPLAGLELYFRIKERPGVFPRLAMAAGLLLMTVAMGAGTAAISALTWFPKLAAAFSNAF